MSRRRLFAIGLTVYVAACGALLVALAWRYGGRREVPVVVERGEPAAAGGPEEIWPKDSQYAVDPLIGHRPLRNTSTKFSMAPLGGGAPVAVERIHNDLGLIDLEDVGDRVGSPSVLVLGDSHLMGVVSNRDNAAHVLETLLREEHGMGGARVHNAASGYYSLYQHALRARSLVSRLEPDWIVVVVFMGNDIHELEDVGRPHLDDAGLERPAVADPPPETTSERLEMLGLPGSDGLFWQGLNQAAYLHQNTDRREALLVKVRRALELLQAEAKRARARLLVVQLPSYMDVFPARVTERVGRAREVVEGGAQREMARRFGAIADELGIERLDLLPAFQADGRDDLYATDYHIFRRGHVLLAQQVAARLAAETASSSPPP